MPWEYSEKVLQLFMDAVQGKAGTHMGKIDEPDGLGEHGSLICGDALRFSFRVKRHPDDPTLDIITEARYLTFGCTSAIASSEALCALLEESRKTPLEALKISNQDLVDYLGGLPEEKLHCSVMGAEALQKAVHDWAIKRGVDLAKQGIYLEQEQEEEEGRLVCKCFSVSEPFLKRKIRELNLHSIEAITHATKAGGGCGACHFAPGGLQDLLNEVWGVTPATTLVSQPQSTGTGCDACSPYRLGKAIENTLDEVIRPHLQSDGGDIKLIDIKQQLVYVRFKGTCTSCHGAEQTLRLLVERELQQRVDEHLRVIEV